MQKLLHAYREAKPGLFTVWQRGTMARFLYLYSPCPSREAYVMANPEHVAVVKAGEAAIRAWRERIHTGLPSHRRMLAPA